MLWHSTKHMNKGTSALEFALVILLIGLLCIATVKAYYKLSENSERAVIMGIVGSLRSTIVIHVAKKRQYPTSCEEIIKELKKSKDYTLICIS